MGFNLSIDCHYLAYVLKSLSLHDHCDDNNPEEDWDFITYAKFFHYVR